MNISAILMAIVLVFSLLFLTLSALSLRRVKAVVMVFAMLLFTLFLLKAGAYFLALFSGYTLPFYFYTLIDVIILIALYLAIIKR